MYEVSNEYTKLAEEVIAEHEDLQAITNFDCKIIFLTCDTPKKRNGKIVYADTEKMKDKMHAITPYDFAVTFYADCDELTEDKLKILMWHELLHVGVKDDGTTFIRHHDVEEFSEIASVHGVDWVYSN